MSLPQTDKLSQQEINQACEQLRKILSSEMEGEFSIGDKVFVEVYREQRRE